PPGLDLCVASLGNPAADDYADYVRRRQAGSCKVEVARLSNPSANSSLQPAIGRGRVRAVILFLNPRLTKHDRGALDEFFSRAVGWDTDFVGVVSTFRVHLGDQAAAEAEAHVFGCAKGLRARTVVFRPGQVLSRSSRTGALLRRFGFIY